MRKIASASAMFLLVCSALVHAQCTNNRYHDMVFPGNPEVTYDVVYGSNLDQNGATVQLKMDIYEPACDNATNRPLIVFAHGGGFVSGDKLDAGYVQTAVALAKLGYVVASINYRLGFPTSPPAGLYGFNSAIMRGLHDARAAVRYMRNNALNGGNTYGVDPSNIFFGGVSAGGIIALHLAYQNTAGEMNLDCGGQPGTNQSSIEGNSNNLNVSSSVKAIMSISGGIRDLSWITNNDIPVFMAHGTVDGTVPYGSSYFYPPLQLFPIHGSSSIATRCTTTGTKYCFKPMYGQDHVPGNVAYVDTIATLMRNFLEHFTCGTTLNCSYTASPALATSSVSIAITSGTNPTCSGQPVTFTATPTNGGSSPTYQWKKNSTNVGTNSSTFTLASPANNDVITCVLTPTVGCGSGTATSNSITMTVTAGGAPAVAVAITSGSNPTCAGQPITFTATPTNGGTAPSYQWKKNNTNVGTNSPTYTLSPPANNDVITCVLTSNSSCANPTTATSTSITVTVSTATAPSVAIALTAGTNPTCSGESLTFTATPTNGGSAPSYQWKKNNANVGTNSSAYTLASPANNDVITCVLTSNSACASPTTATSGPITVTVSATVAATVSVAITTGSNPSCGGEPVTFTATPGNGGSAPAYQWKKNNVNIGNDSPLFTSATLEDGDVISCALTSNSSCANPATATSAAITMAIVETPTIAQNGNTLTASPASTYQWYRDGQEIFGATSQSYTATVNGFYAVKGGNCASQGLEVMVTSVRDLVEADFFSAFPNPNNGSFQISFENAGGKTYQLELRNATGALVHQQSVTGTKQLDVSHYGKGIYFLTLRGDNIAVKKLVVY